jgi:hypothetical protein
MDETHLSVILDLLKNGELDETKATAAIRRMAEHAFSVDSSDEARFARVYHETIEPGYRENYHRPWTPDDIQLLKTMRRCGSDFDQIARRLKRSNRGVRSRWAFEQMLEKENARQTPPPPRIAA